jgi:hypothetical protein
MGRRIASEELGDVGVLKRVVGRKTSNPRELADIDRDGRRTG